jgi:hypothetical protein
VRWRIVDLCQWLFEEFRVIVSEQTLSRELRKMHYRKLSARPRHHAQAEGAIDEYKKTSPRAWTRSRARKASIRSR